MHQADNHHEHRLSSLVSETELTNYNQNAYSIMVFEALLDSKIIDKNHPSYRLFLDKFLSTLLLKHDVDQHILYRKATIQQNVNILKKLQQEFINRVLKSPISSKIRFLRSMDIV